MKTPSHALIGYGCARLFGWKGRLKTAVIFGAVAPDLPVAIAWSWIATAVTLRDGRFHQPAIQVEMDKIYFGDSWLAMLHSLLHSPVSLALLALAVCLTDRRGCWLRPMGLAFLAGALTHSATDILSHVTDGPLLLWPLDDTTRIAGPFSHWDPAFGGLWVSALEAAAATVFVLAWLKIRLGRLLSGRQPSDRRTSSFSQSITAPTAARSVAASARTIQ